MNALTQVEEAAPVCGFVHGLFYATRSGDVVLVNDTTWASVYGTLWKRYASGNWHCYGSRNWQANGRAYDACPAVPSLDDLTHHIAKPHWLDEVAA